MFAGVVGSAVSPPVPRRLSGLGIVGARAGSDGADAAAGASVSAAVADMLDFFGGGDEAG